MSKKDKKPEETVEQVPTEPQQQPEEAPEEAAPQETQAGQSQTETADPLLTELESLKNQVAQQEDKFLRLAAEYDNYRRRTAKEKESIWSEAKADAAGAFLPGYDNLARAYKKGVEMTMNQLKSVLEKLGITEIDALGKPFDPALHNAVMHVEDENFGENTVAEVFQAGFMLGEKVIRFAMVKVAN